MRRSFDRGTARLLMRLYPRSVRERYGTEIVDLFVLRLEEARHAGGLRSRALRWSRATADLALSALLEHRGHHKPASTALCSRSHGPPARERRLLAETAGDLRVATRILRREPVFTAIAVLALAIGLGGNAVMFGVLDGLLLKPLPFEHAERLVRLDESWRDEGRSVAYLNFLDWREASRTFDRMAAVQGWTFAVVSPGSKAEVVPGALVSGDLLAVLGGEPILGRRFEPGDFSTLSPRVAWIGESLWRRRFAADPDVVGGPIRLDGAAFTIAGVLPASFRYPTASRQIWVPAEHVLETRDLENRDSHPGFHVVARLEPGATLGVAIEDMTRITGALADLYPDSNEEHGARLRPLREVYVGNVRPTFVALAIAVGLVLLIACANVASLLLSRVTARRGEMAIRASLGADRRRLVRQLLAESALLAGLGAGLGLLLAVWGMRGARFILSESLRLFGVERVVLDHRVVLITLVAASLTAVIFGLAPALQATRHGADHRPGTRGRLGGGPQPRSTRLQSALVAGQVGISLVLLIATGLMLKSISRLRSSDLGLDPRGVLSFQIELGGERFTDPETTLAVFDEIESAIAALPGVDAVGAVRPLPLTGYNRQSGMSLLDSSVRSPGETLRTDWGWIRPGYFESLRIPLLEGRRIEPTDDADSPLVIAIDETLARAMYPEGALGHRIRFGGANWEIVGVVGAVRHYGARDETHYQVYIPHAQRPTDNLVFTIRSTTDPESLIGTVREQVSRLAPDQPLYAVRTLESLVRQRLAREALLALMLRLFTVVAVALAALGIYGVLAYYVTLRRYEIGLRMAVGATRHHVVRQVAGRGLALAGLGLIAGLLAAPLLARALSTLLFGVSPVDLPIFVTCSLLLAVTAVAATVVPAWRASRVSPVAVLAEG